MLCDVLDDEDSIVVEDGSKAGINSERQLFFVDTTHKEW